jgi:hypothetical protein
MIAASRFLAVAFLAMIAGPAAADSGEPLVRPVEGWLIGVLVLALITMLSRHRSSRGNARTRTMPRGEH